MNNELRKNAEGYTDPTAGAALTQKEPGDIWTYNGGACLIIKSHGKFSTILLLEDQEKHTNQVKIMTKSGPMYADQRLLTYGLHVKMARYVETVSVEDFKRVIEAVEDAVGLSLLATEDVVNPAPREEATSQETARLMELADHMENQQKRLTELEHRYNLQTAELTAANNAATKARNQLELLRDMYNDLLAKMVGGGE